MFRPIPAYILAGGRSSRFGSDKARALVEGRPLISRLADQLAPVASSVTAVADRADKYADLGIATIADRRPGMGPLGGLDTALNDLAHTGKDERLLLVACDMLDVRPAWVEKLLEDEASPAVAFGADRWEPFPAIYSLAVAPLVSEQLDRGQLAMQLLLDRAAARRLNLPQDWPTLAQINTPADHRQAQRNARLSALQGDITRLEVDAIVNAANTTLLGGGGVDGAIHRAAGSDLLRECRTLGGCATGDAKITRGYHLPARHVIHTVGPIYRDGRHGEDAALASCYRRSLEVAVHHAIKTIAFPAISTGVYRFPADQAAVIAVREVRGFLKNDSTIARVTFVCFDDAMLHLYERILSA